MKDVPDTLPDDLPASHAMIRELVDTVREQGRFIDNLQHQLAKLLRARFGRSSEKIDPDQLLLFANEILAAMGPDAASKVEPKPEPPAATKPPKEGH
uniref:IS66 family transposase n=1 Tax=Aquisphaera insulae TaxID=2712864 RepID=UPI00196A2AE7